MIKLRINGEDVDVPEGCTVAAAVMRSGISTFRHSVTGMPRAPLCGMGVCFECRVRIDGVRAVRSCMIRAEEGMEVDAQDR